MRTFRIEKNVAQFVFEKETIKVKNCHFISSAILASYSKVNLLHKILNGILEPVKYTHHEVTPLKIHTDSFCFKITGMSDKQEFLDLLHRIGQADVVNEKKFGSFKVEKKFQSLYIHSAGIYSGCIKSGDDEYEIRNSSINSGILVEQLSLIHI